MLFLCYYIVHNFKFAGLIGAPKRTVYIPTDYKVVQKGFEQQVKVTEQHHRNVPGAP